MKFERGVWSIISVQKRGMVRATPSDKHSHLMEKDGCSPIKCLLGSRRTFLDVISVAPIFAFNVTHVVAYLSCVILHESPYINPMRYATQRKPFIHSSIAVTTWIVLLCYFPFRDQTTMAMTTPQVVLSSFVYFLCFIVCYLPSLYDNTIHSTSVVVLMDISEFNNFSLSQRPLLKISWLDSSTQHIRTLFLAYSTLLLGLDVSTRHPP